MAKLWAFNVGYCTHPACIALRGAGWGSRTFPARAYLIELVDGAYLWDTGYGSHFQEAAQGIYAPYRWVTPVYYNHEREHLIAQLAALGLSPADLHGILISHYHADHVAGLRDYPGVPFLSSAQALEGIKGKRGLRALLQGFIPELLPPDFSTRIRTFSATQWTTLPAALAPFSHGWQVGRAGELFVVPLPGHAAGHVGAFVLTEEGWELLAADATWAPDGYEKIVGPADIAFLVQDNKIEYYQTLTKLHALHQRGVRIHLSHA